MFGSSANALEGSPARSPVARALWEKKAAAAVILSQCTILQLLLVLYSTIHSYLQLHLFAHCIYSSALAPTPAYPFPGRSTSILARVYQVGPLGPIQHVQGAFLVINSELYIGGSRAC